MALLLPLTVISALTSYLRYLSYRQLLLESLAQSALQTCQIVSSGLEHLREHDLSLARRIIGDMVKQRGLWGAVILDAEGNVLLSLGTPPEERARGDGKALSPPAAASPSQGGERGRIVMLPEGDRVYRLVSTLQDTAPSSPATSGTPALFIGDFDMTLVEERLAAYRRSRALLTLGSIAIILWVGDLMIKNTVVSRLKHLLVVVREIGRGNLSARAAVTHRDEITELAEALNVMSEGLTEKARLEQEVRERTAQLRVQAERLAALNTLAGTVCQSLNLRQVLYTALDEVLQLMHLKGGWILLAEGRQDGLGPMVSRGLPEGVALAQVQCTWNRSVQSEVLTLGQPKLFPYTMEYPCPATRHFQTPTGSVALPRNLEYPCAAARYLYRGGLTFRACVPLKSKDRILGVMSLVGDAEDGTHEMGEDALAILTAIGRQIGVAIENATLYEELARKEGLRRQLLARLITAQEEERKRIARELHDQMGQSLTSLIMTLRILSETECSPEAQGYIRELRETVGRILEEIRELALELRPSVLDDLGLLPAIRHYLKELRDKYRLFVDFHALGLDGHRLAPETETALYRIVQEALTNIVRHAQAQNVSVLLDLQADCLKLIVEDDGVGFDVSGTMDIGPDQRNLGLYGMRERVALLGGTLTIESTPGAGTTVYVTIPR